MPAPREPEPIAQSPPPERPRTPQAPVRPFSWSTVVVLALVGISYTRSEKFGLTVACFFVIWFGIRSARVGQILIGTPRNVLWLWEGAPVVVFGVLLAGLAVFTIYFFDAGWLNAL